MIQPVPCDIELSELPEKLADSPDVWGNQPLYLLAQLPQKDISLYGTGDGEQVILRESDTLTAYPLPWLTPRSLLPQLHCGDFDGDGTQELLLLTYTGSGTGISSWTLTILDKTANDWKALALTDSDWSDALSPFLSCEHTEDHKAAIHFSQDSLTVDLEEYVHSETPLEPYVGTIVHYEVLDDSIAAYLAVGLRQEGCIPYTTYYPADLTAQLIYSGDDFSLCSVVLSEYSD